MTTAEITREGLDRLAEELEQLETVGRSQIAERIASAATAEANAIESVDFQDAREEQERLERRIAVLRKRIADAIVVEPDGRNGVVDVGECVHLRNLGTGEQIEYQVVGSLEADPFTRRISAVSPLGRALVGRRRGDVVVVDAPKGRLRFEILGIRKRRTARLRAAS